MTTKIITILLIVFSIPILFSKVETTFFESNKKEQVEYSYEKNAINPNLVEEESINKENNQEFENIKSQSDSPTTKNDSENSKDSCEENCSGEPPTCEEKECQNGDLDDPSACSIDVCNDNGDNDVYMCSSEECVVYLPICDEVTCVDDAEQKEYIYIPNNVEQCIELFYDVDLATGSKIEFDSENDILSTYRGLCNELVNFKPTSYEEFINNRPDGFPPIPIKVEQLGEYLFKTYRVVYEEDI